ncbi:MAG: outer membrane beta-barrel protein [Candidatus Rokubacteria bacterium]|nr:outer membrane beta-barrel protein [Candidatus Rokubacteria bacterium]
MRRLLLALGSLFAVILPLQASGEEKPNSLFVGLGYYFYTGDVEDKTNLDGAVNIEVAYTRSLHPNFAVRGGVGYFHDGRRDDDLRGYPLTVTALGVYPRGRVRLFAGLGLGVYFLEFDGRIDAARVKDADTVWGGHVLIGTSVDVWSSLFVGLEAKYLLLDSASLSGRELDLDGVTVTTAVGFRF